MHAIRIQGLVKSYGRAGPRAVDGIDLSVEPGEVFGLLGPNGAGKTTTVGVCTTRVIPTAGIAEVDGVDVVRDPARAKRSMGVVTQYNTLDRSCTVRENLYFHARYFGLSRAAARKTAERLLEEFRLADRGSALPDELSGGMAQRLQLARALSHRPRVLFLDEPTAGLDPQSRLALWDVIAALKEEGVTVLLTTHYMEEADRLCGRVAILDQGRILVCDTPEALKRGEAGAATLVELEVGREPAQLAERLRALPQVREVTVSETLLRVAIAGQKERALPGLLAATCDHELHQLRISEPTLETVFVGLTGRALRD